MNRQAATVPRTHLVNNLGIAQRLGIKAPAVAHWRARHDDFPAPLDLPGVIGIPLWDWRDVEAWLRETGRRTTPKGA